MKKETKTMFGRIAIFTILFYTFNNFIIHNSSFTYLFSIEELGEITGHILLGFIIFGAIPFGVNYWKKTKVWKNFADKWQLDKELPDR